MKSKDILKYCPNYYKIVNVDIYEGDVITEKLIKLYEEFVFSSDIKYKENQKKLKVMDEIVMKYLCDYKFKKTLSKELTTIKVKSNIINKLDYVISKLIDIFDNYIDSYTRNIYIPRWI